MHGIETTLESDLADAEVAVRRALAAEGFGVLSEIDVAALLSLAAEGFGVLSEIDVAALLTTKLGADRLPLKILGACNPSLAHRALAIDPSVTLVLPCNVVLEEAAPGRTRVAIADPGELIPDAAFTALASEAAELLLAAVRQLHDQA